jgi:hypothetical protein
LHSRHFHRLFSTVGLYDCGPYTVQEWHDRLTIPGTLWPDADPQTSPSVLWSYLMLPLS